MVKIPQITIDIAIIYLVTYRVNERIYVTTQPMPFYALFGFEIKVLQLTHEDALDL
jgi:hypothetical protein